MCNPGSEHPDVHGLQEGLARQGASGDPLEQRGTGVRQGELRQLKVSMHVSPCTEGDVVRLSGDKNLQRGAILSGLGGLEDSPEVIRVHGDVKGSEVSHRVKTRNGLEEEFPQPSGTIPAKASNTEEGDVGEIGPVTGLTE